MDSSVSPKRRNLVSARVSSHFNWPLTVMKPSVTAGLLQSYQPRSLQICNVYFDTQFSKSKRQNSTCGGKKTYTGRGGTVPLILYLGCRRKWVICLTHLPLYPVGKRFLIGWKLGAPQGHFSRTAQEEKKKPIARVRNRTTWWKMRYEVTTFVRA